jgi:cytochrome b6-f complex iron-sulfur subunit
MPDPESPDRRGFMDWFLGTTSGALLASIFYPIVRFLTPPQVREATADEVDAGAENDPELLEKGFKIIRFGAEPVIVVRTADGAFHAFTATCTHLECIVEFRKPQGVLFCNCHNGQFDLTGRNIAGPPPHPLTNLSVHRVAKSGGPATLVVSRKS